MKEGILSSKMAKMQNKTKSRIKSAPSYAVKNYLCIRVMEVMKELRKFRICDNTVFFFAKIQLDKVRIQGEGDILVKGRLLNNLTKFVKTHGATTVGVEKLKSCPIEGVWDAQSALESVKFFK